MAVAYVQAAQGAGTGTSLTVTLGTATTAGNCVLVMIYSDCSSVSQTVTGVTLGGSAGNFSQIAAESIPSNSLYTWAWADPSCAGGQTSIVVTTSQTSAYTLAAQLYEVSGVVAAGVLDLSAGASTTSGTVIGPAATGVTSLAWEFWCGFAAGVIGGATSFNGPASGGWTNEAVIKHTGAGDPDFIVSGYQVAAATGEASYEGYWLGNIGEGLGCALVVTLLPNVPFVLQSGGIYNTRYPDQQTSLELTGLTTAGGPRPVPDHHPD